MQPTHPIRRRGTVVAAALALLLVTGCSDDPEQADVERVTDTSTAGGAAGGDAQPASEAAPAEPASSEPQTDTEPQTGAEPQGEPLASASLPINFIEGGELDIAVMSLEVTGELLRMALTFTASLPVEAENVGIGAVITADENAPAAGIFPELIDPVNLKAYQAVTGYVPNGTGIYLEDGASHTQVFYFAAPQDEVDTFDIRLASQAPPITDVPFAP